MFSGALDLDTVAGRRTTATGWSASRYSAHIPGVAGPPAQTYWCSSTRRTPAAGWGTTSTRRCLAAHAEPRHRPADAGLRRRPRPPWRWRCTGATRSVQLSITSRVELVERHRADATRRRHPRGGRRPDVPRPRRAATRWWRRARPTPRRANNHLMTRDEIRSTGSSRRARQSSAWPASTGSRRRSASASCRETAPRAAWASRASTPRFRGRGLGRLVKQHVHHRAARARHPAADARTTSSTTTGIRRLNEELGLRPRLRRAPDAPHALIRLNRGVLAPSGPASPSRPRGRRAARRPATSGRRATRR